MASLQNPKVMAALQAMQSDPSKIMQYMSDPDVGPILQKMAAAAQSGGMPGMGGGMPGGMGGGMGMPGSSPNFGGGATGDDDDDELPDLEEVDEVD